VHDVVTLEIDKGAGKTGCRPHPWPASRKKAGGENHRFSRTSGLPCAMGYGLYVIFPGTGLFCPRHLADRTPARLGLGVGRPGPHDFAVRADDARPASSSRPSHPRLTLVAAPEAARRDPSESAVGESLFLPRSGGWACASALANGSWRPSLSSVPPAIAWAPCPRCGTRLDARDVGYQPRQAPSSSRGRIGEASLMQAA
jgi:hypothetical protein